MASYDDEEIETTMSSQSVPRVNPTRELDALLDELDTLLKNGDVMGALGERGVNASIALAASGALRAYFAADKARAADDFGMVSEEIAGRLGREPRANGGS